MRGVDWLQNVHWLVTYFVAGWGLGWLAVRERRWAVVPALCTVSVMVTGFADRLQNVIPVSSNLARTTVAAGIGLLALRAVSRFPALTWRVSVGAVLVPGVAVMCFWLGFLLFVTVFQIP